MDLKDLKTISKLIKMYGLCDVENAIKLNKIFLSYMNKETLEHANKNHSMYFETDKEQFFTNGETSIFCLKPSIIDFGLLKSDDLVANFDCVSHDEINSYLDKAKKMLANRLVDVSYISFLRGSIMSFYEDPAACRQISIQEGKLIELLFNKYEIKGSKSEPIIHVEADNGYAYILGKRNNGLQKKF